MASYLFDEDETPRKSYLFDDPVAPPPSSGWDWSKRAGTNKPAPIMRRDRRGFSIEQDLARERALNPTTPGNDFARGVGAFGSSAWRALQYPFADEKKRHSLKAEGLLAEMAQRGESSSFNVGRGAAPFAVPGFGPAKLGAQMGEAALTSLGLNLLDFDRRPTGGGLAADAASAAAVPAAIRGAAKVLPNGLISKAAGFVMDPLNVTQGKLRKSHQLEEAGIRLSPAEFSGSKTRATAENMMQRGRAGARKAFQEKKEHNTRAMNGIAAEAVDMGPGHTSLTGELLDTAKTKAKNTMNRVTDEVTMPYDAEFHYDLSRIKDSVGGEEAQRMTGLAPAAREVADSWMEKSLKAKPISGKDYQDMEQRVGQQARDAYNAGQKDLGDTYKAVQRALDGLMDRNIPPGSMAEYRKAKKAYANYQVLAKPGVVDSYGDVNPEKVKSILQKNKQFQDKRARGEDATPMDRIWDYAGIQKELPAMPPMSPSLTERAMFFAPSLALDYVPTKKYLGSRNAQGIPGPTGGIGAYLGGRLGGTEMTEALFDSVIRGGGESPEEQGSGIFGSGVVDFLGQLKQPLY